MIGHRKGLGGRCDRRLSPRVWHTLFWRFCDLQLMSLFMYAQGIFFFFFCKNEKYQEGIIKKKRIIQKVEMLGYMNEKIKVKGYYLLLELNVSY